MRAVESHSFRRFSRFGRRLEDALPNSLRTPAVEAIVDRLGRPIFRRTIDPSTSALEHMHDPAQNAPIVLRLHATAIAWNKRLNPRPLPVAKPKQVRPHLLAPIRLTNPLNLNMVNWVLTLKVPCNGRLFPFPAVIWGKAYRKVCKSWVVPGTRRRSLAMPMPMNKRLTTAARRRRSRH